MQNLFNTADRDAVLGRLEALQPTGTRQWGTMTAAQALAHCSLALEMACGERKKPQALLGRLVTPFIRSTVLGEKPMGRNAPTDRDLVVADDRDFAAEQRRLAGMIDRFVRLGPDAAGTQVHSFFGRFTGDEWGRLMYKHVDHHLRQFGA